MKSALAAEALFEGARGSTSSLIIEDFSDAAWLETECGEAFRPKIEEFLNKVAHR